jgi:hypothetical protein
VHELESELGIVYRLRFSGPLKPDRKSTLLVVLNEEEAEKSPDWLGEVAEPDQTVVYCEPRGIGETRWTRKNGPNYVERSHALLGRTVDAGRIWDVIAAAKYLAQRERGKIPLYVSGRGPAGLIAGYAAALEDEIAGAALISPSASHLVADAPQILNVLRVCDAPDILGLIAPRPLSIAADASDAFARTAAAYSAAGAADKLKFE